MNQSKYSQQMQVAFNTGFKDGRAGVERNDSDAQNWVQVYLPWDNLFLHKDALETYRKGYEKGEGKNEEEG